MKKFFSDNSLFILTIVAIVTLTFSGITFFTNNVTKVENFFQSITKPFYEASYSVSEFFSSIGDHFASIDKLQQENEELKQKIAELEASNRDTDALVSENSQLRQLLNLKEQRKDLTLEPATIIHSSVANWTSSYTLNKGTNSGIKTNDCALDIYGNLVGIVTSCDKEWSVITTILDPDSEIGALVFRTNSSCVANGHITLMNDNRLEVHYLRDSNTVLNGDLLVTSGLGNHYPSGIPIGSIVEILPDETGVNQYAIISPSADINSLTEVFIVTAFSSLGE